MLNQVPLVKTTYSGEEIVQALIEAWQSLFGEVPSENVIGVLYAQNSQETGYSKSMYNNNIGNIKAVDRSVGTVNYMVIPGTWEILNGKRVVLAQDNPGSRFLAFATLKEGVEHHLTFLKQSRFSKAWNSLLTGSPENFSRQLKAQKYYTAPESEYTTALVWIFNKYKKDKLYNKAMEKIILPVVAQPTIPPIEIPLEDVKPTETVHDPKLSLNWWQTLLQFIMQLFMKK